MLQNCRQHHHGLSLCAAKRELGSADAVIRRTGQHSVDRIPALGGFLQPHVEAGFTVIAPLDGSVIAGKLKLVFPVELQRDRLQAGRRLRGADDRRYARGGNQSEQEAGNPQFPALRVMKTSRSNRCTSCSFFSSAPASGGMIFEWSLPRRVSGEMS